MSSIEARAVRSLFLCHRMDTYSLEEIQEHIVEIVEDLVKRNDQLKEDYNAQVLLATFNTTQRPKFITTKKTNSNI